MESLFWCFLMKFSEICKNTFFAEQQRTNACDLAVSTVTKPVLANKTTINYDPKTKAYII